MPNSKQVKIEVALFEHLKTETGANDRVYPEVLPQNSEYPAITYQQVYSDTHHDIDVDFPRYQVTAWHERRIEAMDLANEIDVALNRFKGHLNNEEPIKRIVKEPGPGVLFDRDAGDYGVYYVPQDFKIIFYRKKGV